MMYIRHFLCMVLTMLLGLRETSLHTAGFIYGITGTTIALRLYGLGFHSRLAIEYWW